MGLVAVTLGCATTDERFGGARKMLDFGFANYSIYTPPIDQEQLQPVPVLHGVEPSVAPQAAAPSPILLKKGQEKGVSVIVELAENLEAPVVEGQAIGSISVKLDDQEIASYPITASSGVPADYLRRRFPLASAGAVWVIRNTKRILFGIIY